jgi:hypothetical protein
VEFNRERFLLKLIAGVIIAQLSFYGLGAMVCAWRYVVSGRAVVGACQPLQANLNRQAEIALNVLLALLGAGAVTAEAISDRRSRRRQDEEGSGPPLPPEPPQERPRPPADPDPRF